MSEKIEVNKVLDRQLLLDVKDELYMRVKQDIFFVKVRKIEEYHYDGYVYDLSIDTTHNFIAENMLVHNTDMAVKISMAKRFTVNFVLCPPHLVDKWEDEILMNYADHESVKVIKVNRWEDLAPFSRRNMRKDGIKYYFVISRESAKLGYPKVPAVRLSQKQVVNYREIDDETVQVTEYIEVAKCPDCNHEILEAEYPSYKVNLDKVSYKCKECGSILRDVDRSVSKNLQRRLSIAEYVKRYWTKGAIDLLIVDEAHEYKGGNTGQGNALAQLASMSKKIVGLTGTLLNGYASSLFYIMYRLNPCLMKRELGFDYNQVQLFVDRYGATERTMEAKEINIEGVVTKMGKQINVKERPKISHYLLWVLLKMTIFLRLDEMKMNKKDLPD